MQTKKTARRIIAVGTSIPGGDILAVSFRADQSLLDADIIVFEPNIGDEYEVKELFHGKPRITDADSFRLVEDIRHWNSELQIAVHSGKTIFVFMTKLQQAYVDTGKRQYSGTGRSQKTTVIVDLKSNYDAIPADLGRVIPKSGSEIVAARSLEVLATYWHEFASRSSYEVYLENQAPEPFLVTKTGGKFVGGMLRKGPGTFVFLPQFYQPTKNAHAFGKRLVALLVAIDEALRAAKAQTPPPDWTHDLQYEFRAEKELREQIAVLSEEMRKTEERRSNAVRRLLGEGELRKLLYESGHQLEEAIIDALGILGFAAAPFKKGESEFDVVFESSEGRLIGEAEGKDNKPVNIDKMSQLERNIQEDFAREEVKEYAKGVLFGNAFRMSPPTGRNEFFTQKCMSAARRLKVALVRTPDLFIVVKRLKEKPDPAYAKVCREAIFRTEGDVVAFP